MEDHEQKLKEVRKYLGGSEAAAVLGLSRYQSALSVYLRQIGEDVSVPDNEKMLWGRLLESVIAKEYERRTGYQTWHNNKYKHYTHFRHSWMGCLPDAIAHDPERGNGVIEIKTASEYVKHEWNDGNSPEEYIVQLMHNMAVVGTSWGALVVLIGGSDFRIVPFDRDDELIDLIIQKESEFWHNHVLKRIPPDPTGASLDVLSKLYRKDNGTSIVLRQDEIGKAIHQYLDTKAALDELSKKNDDAKAVIQAAMGEASQGIYQDNGTTYGISWSTVKGRVSFDAKALEKDYPDLYGKYMKTGASYRRFAVKEKKAEIGHTKVKEVANG